MKVPFDGMSQLTIQSNPATAKKTALVYVVDDEPMVGDVVQAILKMGGYESVLFDDPKTAFQALRIPNPRCC
jgi:FixJ family two-component response regulator